MPFKAVEQVMDSVAGAAYIERELLHVMSVAHEEIIPGFDLRDAVPAVVNQEGADMDAIARDNVKAYGEPTWVSKDQDVQKGEVKETREQKIKGMFDLVVTAKFKRKELRQAAKVNRPLQASRLNNGKNVLNLAIRNAMVDGVPELGMAGLLSSLDHLVHDQAGSAFSGLSDAAVEDLMLGYVEQFINEIGTDYPISHILMAPSFNTRLSRTKGVEGGRTMKAVIADILNVPLQNFIVDHRLKSKSVGSYTSKDFMVFLPAYPRIFEILNPIRLMQDDPYMEGSTLCVDQIVQYGGLDFHEKIGALADA